MAATRGNHPGPRRPGQDRVLVRRRCSAGREHDDLPHTFARSRAGSYRWRASLDRRTGHPGGDPDQNLSITSVAFAPAEPPGSSRTHSACNSPSARVPAGRNPPRTTRWIRERFPPAPSTTSPALVRVSRWRTARVGVRRFTRPPDLAVPGTAEPRRDPCVLALVHTCHGPPCRSGGAARPFARSGEHRRSVGHAAQRIGHVRLQTRPMRDLVRRFTIVGPLR